MVPASLIWQTISALISLIPMVMAIIKEDKIRASSQQDLARAIVAEMQKRFAKVDAAMNGPDTDPYAKPKGKTK